MRILLVEDDPGVASSLRDGLAGSGFDVEHVATGGAGIARVERSRAPRAGNGGNGSSDSDEAGLDAVVLDLGLPDIDGQDVCRRIRAISDVPVLVISARGEEVDRVLALEFGADDYLTKPFGQRELVARIRAVLRRTQAGAAAVPEPPAAQDLGRLVIDRRTQRVLLDGEEVRLTAKEFDLLAFLCEDPGAVRRRTEILENVWDAHWYGPTKTVDAHVAAIRKKLGGAEWIEAVRGVGFRLGPTA